MCVLLVLLWPASAHAQSLVNPQRVEFAPSPDHFAALPDGTAVVTSYQIELYRSGESMPFQTLNLGKPALESDGKIRVDFVSMISPSLPSGVVYEARIRAVGPGGAADSAPSNTFSFATSCTFSLAPSGGTAPASGASGTITVTTQTGCGWTATSTAPWITVSTGASGTGSGGVGYAVAANTASTQRTGSLSVAGQTFTVTQAGSACSYVMTPTGQNVPAAGGTSSFTVAAPAGCAWTAVPSATWITVAAGQSGSGNGTVTVTAAANTATTARSGGVNVGAQVFAVSQAAATCGFTVSPTSQAFPASGGSASITVTTATGCSWTSSTSANWITIGSNTTRTAAGAVTISATTNTSSSARSATVLVAGQQVAVSQAGTTSTCTFTLSPTSKVVNGKASKGTISVSTGSGCNWTAVSNASWLTATGSGTTAGSVTYSVTVNTTNTARSATITVGGAVVSIVQRSDTSPTPPGHLKIVTTGGK